MSPARKPLFIVLISIHGLIRAREPELGRDADTGGQVKYVVELARALGERSDVEKVVLLTRRIVDPAVSADYAAPIEAISGKASIVRIECGEETYIRKEKLWDSLENFSDNALAWLRSQAKLPDILHAHYADAGYVGSRLSYQLGIPLVFTGHSLGRNKRKQLLASGESRIEIETTYAISRRIEAEENTLGAAQLVITSTQQEIEQQYGIYDFYQPDSMRVIPPGTDLERFHPIQAGENFKGLQTELRRFLTAPEKPVILALSRPDPKKNIITLIEAYGESPALQAAANLMIIAGNRDDIRDMDNVARNVLTDIMLTIDKYDLYGKVACPKHHKPEDVPQIYRMVAATGGIFINPALIEPFGLTLIEAAACGLPVVATEEGGPVDIIGNCRNGQLVNPLDPAAIARTLLEMLQDKKTWAQYSANGIAGVKAHYSWHAHVESYMQVIRPLAEKTLLPVRPNAMRRTDLYRHRALIASLDLNLIGDQQSLHELLGLLRAERKTTIFGIATGRRLDDALATMTQHRIPRPDVLITSQGTEIHYSSSLTEDTAWQRHINYNWNPQIIRDLLKDIPGLKLQPKLNQSQFKISYFINPEICRPKEIRQILLRNEQVAQIIYSFGQFIDILPVRASKGLALRWCADQSGFELGKTLVAGVTGADIDMLLGNTLGTVVDNRHLEELSGLSNIDRIYFSSHAHAAGILEAIRHYHFFGQPQQAVQS